jgi:adenylosuccinate synthase
MHQKRQAIFIADLGFGDAGKGSITDFLTRELCAHTVVRYNGGPQAAHSVVTIDGKQHTFSQFGSGTLLSSTKTLLSRFMLINPLNLLKEERHLRTLGITDALQRTLIDRRALVITPFQRAINRLREIARAENRHGSCGEGIGECMSDALKYGNDALFAGDLRDRATLRKKLHFLHAAKLNELDEFIHLLPNTEPVRRECAVFTTPNSLEDCIDVYHYFSDCVAIIDETAIQTLLTQSGTILFEGAQGVLLDENYGFTPYTTWSTTTFANAETLLQEHDYAGEVIKLGLLRAYATRHGAGPFPTEDRALTLSLPDQHNTWNDWQRTFRVGYLDLVAARYAKDVLGKLDYLALTNLDRLEMMPEWKICHSYSYQLQSCEKTYAPGTTSEGMYRDETPRDQVEMQPEEQKDLHSFFEQEHGKITGIHVQRPADLAYQEKLTQRLWSCTPEYRTLPPKSGRQYSQEDRERYLSLIGEALAVPIAITSYGPTASDKQCLPMQLYTEPTSTGR